MSRTQARPTQAERVVAILRDGSWHSTLSFIDAGILRAGARIYELRLAGHAIETRRRPGSQIHEYRLSDRRSNRPRDPRSLPVPPVRIGRSAGPCVVCELVDVDAALIGGQWWCSRHAELAA